LGIADEVIQQAFRQFAGVGRRLQNYGELSLNQGSVLLIDDYGHHPREITATWSAVRQAWPERRLVVAYQPHRYTRTRDLFDEFVQVLSEQVDQLLLLDIYSAGESPIPDADGMALFNAVSKRSKFPPVFVPHTEALFRVLPQVLKAGDVLLTQGAGNIGGIAPALAENGFLTS
jgi:UDP-N-acetylmuramate--alanine ligase